MSPRAVSGVAAIPLRMSRINAGIITVGDELTSGDRVDTNSGWLSERLLELGIETAFHLALPDDLQSLADSIVESSLRVEVLLITGGLGPTEDDLTRQALATALGEVLVTDEPSRAALKSRFEKRGMEMPARNLQQVQRPSSAKMIPNNLGTAPGLAARIGNAAIYVMPGVPGEMKHMWTEHVEPALRAGAGTGEDKCLTTWIHGVSMAEGKVGEVIEDLMQRGGQPVVGTLVRDFIVSVRVRAAGPRDIVEDLVAAAARTVKERLGVYAFGKDDDTLAGVVLRLLAARSATLTTAESCTGGLLGSMITEVPGASSVYLGGWVTYSNAFKEFIDVDTTTLHQHGAVSGLTADQMAIGALTQSGAGFALAITGVAGPEGGSESKPVGTVFIGMAFIDEDGEPTSHVRHFVFTGSRDMVRQRAAISALAMLQFHLANDGVLPDMLGEFRPRVEAGAS